MNPCIGVVCDKFQQISVTRINGIQRRQHVSHQLICVLSAILTVGWFFRAHVHRFGPDSCFQRLARIATQHCCNQTVPQWRIRVARASIQRETLCHLFIGDACIFSRIEKKNYQKPFVINISCPLLNSIQHSKKAVFLCQISWGLCVWSWQMESVDGECTRMHTAQESILGLWGLARKLTRLGSEGSWIEKVKIVKCHVLMFSLQCNGYQGIDYKCLKTDVPCVQSVLGMLQE